MKYLYVIHIQVYRHSGQLFMERIAALDLQAHQRLLPREVSLVLAAPVVDSPGAGVNFDSLERIEPVEFIPLQYVDGLKSGISGYSHNRKKLALAVAAADLVHTGCGGFPFFLSPCYVAFRQALAMRKKVLFVMDCDLVGKLEMDQIRLTINLPKKAVWYLFSRLCWHLYTRCLTTASATFLLGRGVVSRYGRYANNPLEIYQPIVGPEMIIPDAELQAKVQHLKNSAIPKICFAGRLAPEKGLDVMFHALAKLKDRLQFSVNIYGDGPYREKYLELAEKLGIQGVTTFHGNKQWGEDLFGELRKNHILVVPHMTLEMTRNVFDGMASGCAIIASNTEALSSLVEDSGAGFLFKTGDHSELAETLAAQIGKPQELSASIKNGVVFVKANNRDSNVQRRLDFLEKSLPLRF